MNRIIPWNAGALALVLFLGSGLWSPVAAKAMPKKLCSALREMIYARAEHYFTNAMLLKPREDGAATNQAFRLAPLLLQEVAGSNSVAAPAVVYFDTGQILLSGKTHAQVTYLWDVDGASTRRQFVPARRGIRLTLDTHGLPVIWEVLNDPSGAHVILVAQSLEAGALKTYGGVLPGRRFAVEADLATAPDSIVARVIEDGPAVMGPLVHLSATGEVTTLICRCMTAQTRAVEKTGNYELRPYAEISRTPIPATEVDQWLRLPPEF